MNRKGPWEGYRRLAFPPSFARTSSSQERRLGTRQVKYYIRIRIVQRFFRREANVFSPLICKNQTLEHLERILHIYYFSFFMFNGVDEHLKVRKNAQDIRATCSATLLYGVLEMQNFTPSYIKGWTYVRTDDFVRTKMSWLHR